MTPTLPPVGPSGLIARVFQSSQLTPLLALTVILLGILAVIVTPKEEEPQINVTMVDIFIGLPGASVAEVESVIATPAEQVMSEIEGVKHVYSVSRQGHAVITIEFKVGLPRQEALLRLYNQVYSNQDWLPPDLGATQPLVKPQGIDDVPIMSLTFYDPTGRSTGTDLTRLAHTLEVALKNVAGTRDIYTLGGTPDRVEVHLDPALLNGYGLTVADLEAALHSANASGNERRITQTGVSIPLRVGLLLEDVESVRRLVVGMHAGAAVFLEDVATVTRGESVPDRSVMMGFGPAADDLHGSAGDLYPAVTIAVAKQPGENASDITRSIESELQRLRNQLIPEGVAIVTSRDYGKTATAKARQLISDLISATVGVVLLVLIAMGWRQGLIVGLSVLVTLLLTLIFSWAWGFTLNRVSLFALIFSIGILVDDAIVVTENINRRIRTSRQPIKTIIPIAVDEVGTPTIMASLTVMAALLPMAFVSGLMGPYMSPIPINASAGMVFSQIVAFVLVPWLAVRLLAHQQGVAVTDNTQAASSADGVSPLARRGFNWLLSPFLGNRRLARWLLAVGVVGLTFLAMLLPVFQAVILKMLPFDNKSEFQVVVDMPEHTPLERTQQVLLALGEYLQTVPEVTNWQAYAGTSSPINFNGLVRQYYLRNDPYQGDIQVNLVDDSDRDRQSHEISTAIRPYLQEIGRQFDANVKVVEVPPGPPVLAPLVAEVYALDPQRRTGLARDLADSMGKIDGLVDIDTTVTAPTHQWELVIDRARAARFGVSQAQVVDALKMATGDRNAGYLRDSQAKYPVPIRVILSEGDKAQQAAILSLSVRSRHGDLIPLASIAEFQERWWEGARYHKDLLPVTYVTADMAGRIDSPLYGMFSLVSQLNERTDSPAQYYIQQPPLSAQVAFKWDGEWQITYETFRDMGLAYSVGVLMIFLLLVAQFRSYVLPMVIMAPIPLTLIGILPGHALLGQEFTATSMIGMIALAGIIVRNSILLVVFIKQLTEEGVALEDAVVLAGAVRFKPIALTAVSAMVGAYFILSDPIFNGLAISLIFGLSVSTLLTMLIVPLLYYTLARRGWV